jgi:adenine phosphoribosyltransferase
LTVFEYLALIVSGSGRCDVTPLFADGPAFQALIDDMLALVADLDYELVAGIDGLGFVLGAAMAARTARGFVAIRKGGRLPVPAERVAFVDYTGREKELEVQRDVPWGGARVLIVDEWIETGAQMRAAASLLARHGATVTALVTIHCDDNPETELLSREFPLLALRRGN